MLFRYKINLEVDIEFEAPLLGVDTTGRKVKSANLFAKELIKELVNQNSTNMEIVRDVDLDNFRGKVRASKELGKSPKNKY